MLGPTVQRSERASVECFKIWSVLTVNKFIMFVHLLLYFNKIRIY